MNHERMCWLSFCSSFTKSSAAVACKLASLVTFLAQPYMILFLVRLCFYSQSLLSWKIYVFVWFWGISPIYLSPILTWLSGLLHMIDLDQLDMTPLVSSYHPWQSHVRLPLSTFLGRWLYFNRTYSISQALTGRIKWRSVIKFKFKC